MTRSAEIELNMMNRMPASVTCSNVWASDGGVSKLRSRCTDPKLYKPHRTDIPEGGLPMLRNTHMQLASL